MPHTISFVMGHLVIFVYASYMEDQSLHLQLNNIHAQMTGKLLWFIFLLLEGQGLCL